MIFRALKALGDPFVLFPSWLLFSSLLLFAQALFPLSSFSAEAFLSGEVNLGLGSQIALGLASAWVWGSAFLLAHSRLLSGIAPPASSPIAHAFFRLPSIFLVTTLQGFLLGLVSSIGASLYFLPTLVLWTLLFFAPALAFLGAPPLSTFHASMKRVWPQFFPYLGSLFALGSFFMAGVFFLSILLSLLFSASSLEEIPFWVAPIILGGAFPILSVGWAVMTAGSFPPKERKKD